MDYSQAIGLGRRQQNATARFSVHEDSDKENRAAGVLSRADQETCPPRFRKTSPISRESASSSGWIGGRHVMGGQRDGLQNSNTKKWQSLAEDTIVVEGPGRPKSLHPADNLEQYTSDGVEHDSEYIEDETEMFDFADDHDVSEFEAGGEERLDYGNATHVQHDSDALKHAKAYSRMIKGAAPSLSAGNLGEEILSKKRSREIFETGTSSSNEPLSPHKYVNSPPRRPVKRNCTPPAGDRRKSAPSNLERGPMEGYEDMVLKKEPTRAFPEHIVGGVQRLREKHEGSIFELGDSWVRCVDCDHTFQIPAKTKSFAGPNTHCRAAPHRLAVQKRILLQEKYDSPLQKTTSKMTGFDMPPPPPVTTLGNHEYTGFSNPLGDVFTALQRSSTETYNQHIAEKQRLDTIEKQLKAQSGHFTAILGLSQSSESKYQALAKKQRDTEATLDTISQNQIQIETQFRNEQADLEDRLQQLGDSTMDKVSILENRIEDIQVENKLAALEEDSQQSRIENQREFEALRASIKEGTERSRQQLSILNKDLAAAIRYNSQQIQETRHDISPLNKHMSEQLQRNFSLEGQLKNHWSFISAQTHYNNENHPRFLTIEDLTRHNSKYIIQLQEKTKELQTRADNHGSAFTRGHGVEMVIRNEIKKLRESDRQLQTNIQPIALSAPKVQHHRQDENLNSSEQSIMEQIGAQLATRFDARLKSMEDTFKARLAKVQSESSEQISQLQAQGKKQTQMLQTLEMENEKLRSFIPVINKDMQEMSECFNEVLPDLGDKVESLEQQLSTLNSLLPSGLHNHTTQQTREEGPRRFTQEEIDLVEARFHRIETAIPALFEQTSYIRDCFAESAEEDENNDDDDNFDARLNRIEHILPVVIEEAMKLRACVDDLGEIIGAERDPIANDESEDENEDLSSDEAESDWEGNDDIKEEDFDD